MHQYSPYVYTHQPPDGTKAYPGTFDADYDGAPDTFDRAWLENLLSTVDALGLTIAVNEFGVMRWVPGAAGYMEDTFDLFERRGWNHALWMWFPALYPADLAEFDFMLGPDTTHYRDVITSELIETIRSNWVKNTLRPSNVTFSPTSGRPGR